MGRYAQIDGKQLGFRGIAEAALAAGWKNNGEHAVELPYYMVEKMCYHIVSTLPLHFAAGVYGDAKAFEQFKLGLLYLWLSQHSGEDTLVMV
jgi:hypothetical protein